MRSAHRHDADGAQREHRARGDEGLDARPVGHAELDFDAAREHRHVQRGGQDLRARRGDGGARDAHLRRAHHQVQVHHEVHQPGEPRHAQRRRRVALPQARGGAHHGHQRGG